MNTTNFTYVATEDTPNTLSPLPIEECHHALPNSWFPEPETAPLGAKQSRAKPDKGRRRKHEDLYLLHYRSVEGDKHPFTGDLQKDLQIFHVLLTDASGYRPGLDLLVPPVLLSAVAERWIKGGGLYSYHSIMRNLDSASRSPEFVLDYLLKQIRDYTPNLRARKIRKYIFQIYIKNFNTAFSSVPAHAHTWRSDMWNFKEAVASAMADIDLTPAAQKVVNEVDLNPLADKFTAAAQKSVDTIDVTALSNKFLKSVENAAPSIGDKMGQSAGSGVVAGVFSKFSEIFNSSLSAIKDTWTSQPTILKRAIVIAGVLSAVSLVAFFGRKLVIYCFPTMFGPLPSVTATSDGDESNFSYFCDWFSNQFTGIKSFTPFSQSSMFSKIKDSITILAFFEKLSSAAKALGTLVKSIIDWACFKLTNSYFFDSSVKLHNLITRVDSLLTSLQADSYVSLQEQEQFCDSFAECTALADGIFKIDLTLHLKMIQVLTAKQHLFDKFQKNVKSGDCRQEPTLIWMTGDPGVAKSNTIDALFQAVFHNLKHTPAVFQDIKEPTWRTGMIGTRSGDDKFYSNYSENWGFIMDDVFQNTDPQCQASESSMICMAKQRARFPLVSAAISDKGKLFFKSKIMCCTSNYSEQLLRSSVPMMYSSGAFQRRRDFIVHISKIPDIPSAPMGTIEQWNDKHFDVQYWDFNTASHKPLFSLPGLKGFASLVLAVSDRYISYYDVHHRIMSFDIAQHMSTIMDAVRPPSTIPVKDFPTPPDSDSDPEDDGTGVFPPPKDLSSTTAAPQSTTTTTSYVPPPEKFDFGPPPPSRPSHTEGMAKDSFIRTHMPAINTFLEKLMVAGKALSEDPVFNKTLNDVREQDFPLTDVVSTSPPEYFDAETDLEASPKKTATSDMWAHPYMKAKKIAARLGVENLWKLPITSADGLIPADVPRLYEWAHSKRMAEKIDGTKTPSIDLTDFGSCFGLNPVASSKLYRFLRANHFPFSKVPVNSLFQIAVLSDLMNRVDNDSYLVDFDIYYVMKSSPWHATAMSSGFIMTPAPATLVHFYEIGASCLNISIFQTMVGYIKSTTDYNVAFDCPLDIQSPPHDEISYGFVEAGLYQIFSFLCWTALIALVVGAVRLIIYGLRALGVLSPEQEEFFSDSGDVELNNRQTTVLAQIRKAARPPAAPAKPTASSEAFSSDHSTNLNPASKRLMSNLMLVGFNLSTPSGMSCSDNFVYFMSANVMIIPTHYLARAPYASITIYPTYKQSKIAQEIISWNDCILLETTGFPIAKKLARRDLTAIYVPGIRFMKPDMVRMLPSELELANYQNYHGVERLGFDASDGPLSIMRVATSATPRLFGLTSDKTTLTTQQNVTLYDYFSVRGMLGGPGTCMSPYVPLQTSHNFQIMGFHVASDPTIISCVFSPFTKEDYHDVLAAFRTSTGDLISYNPTDDLFYDSENAPFKPVDALSSYQGIKVQFELDRKVTSSPYSSLIETIVSKGIPNHDPPFPRDDAPASLSKRAKELALRKLDGKITYYDSTVFEDVRVFEGSFPPHLTREFCLRFLTLEQVVNGIPATRMHSTDLNKASGAPYNMYGISKKKLIRRDSPVSNICIPDWYLDTSLPTSVPPLTFFRERNVKGLWIAPDLQRHFYWFHHWSRAGMSPLAIFTFFLKDELRPTDRVLKEYTRYINAGQLAHQFFCRSVMGYYTDQLESDLNISIQLGINPFSAQWGALYRRLNSKCPNDSRFVLHDVSGWDLRFQVHYFAKYVKRFRSFFHLDLKNHFDNAFYNCVKSVYVSTLMPMVLIENKLVSLLAMPSGGERTSTFNSNANDAEHRQIWYWHNDTVSFSKQNELGIFGDDSILSGPFDSEYNGVTIGEVRKIIFNHDCTESTKDETLVPFQPTSNALFLSRGFRIEKNLVLAPLKINSIQAMCRYIMKPTDKTIAGQTALNLHVALNEFALHGKEVFDTALAQLQPFLLYLGEEHRYPHTYETLWPVIVAMYSGELPATAFKLQFSH